MPSEPRDAPAVGTLPDRWPLDARAAEDPLFGARRTAGLPPEGPGGPDGEAAALRRAVEHLLVLQDRAGWWKGELETNVTMDAEDLLLRHVLGVDDPRRLAAASRWIRSQQRTDGTWANFHGGPPDLSTTVEAYVGLRLAGDAPDAPHLTDAARYVREAGGLERTRVFTRIWLAMVGLWDWERLPSMPPELILLPKWFPLNIYDFGCWARQTVVALTVVAAHRPVRPVPFALDELRSGVEPRPRRTVTALWSWDSRFHLLDRVLRRYERRPWRALRRRALSSAERWILRRQEADGSWGGIQPPWVYSLLALQALGYPVDHPAIAAGLDGLERFTIREWRDDAAPGAGGGNAERGRADRPGIEASTGTVEWCRLEACQSPVWDTALAVIALADAGITVDDPALQRAGEWLLGEEIRAGGDWAVRRPGLAPGGWAFEFHNVNYPDVDDTAEVVMALRRVSLQPGTPVDEAIERAERWSVGMRSNGGGWGAFDADNTRQLVRKLPFCDFGAVIDPPSADVTAHMVEMLAATSAPDDPVLVAGVRWLWDNQEADGSWFGRWGANFVYGTGAAVPALVAAGVAADDPRLLRARSWLLDHQNPDGGWGEDLRSYVDDAWRGRGESTPSQTAWALLALLALGDRGEATRAGVRHLVTTQRPDGTWDEPFYTGTGFPGDFYINYHLYRLVFPVMALGRWERGDR